MSHDGCKVGKALRVSGSILDCKTVVFFALVMQMRAVFEQKVWSTDIWRVELRIDAMACALSARVSTLPTLSALRAFASKPRSILFIFRSEISDVTHRCYETAIHARFNFLFHFVRKFQILQGIQVSSELL